MWQLSGIKICVSANTWMGAEYHHFCCLAGDRFPRGQTRSWKKRGYSLCQREGGSKKDIVIKVKQHVPRRDDLKGHGIWGGVKESEGRPWGECGGQWSWCDSSRWYFWHLYKLCCGKRFTLCGCPWGCVEWPHSDVGIPLRLSDGLLLYASMSAVCLCK